MFFGKYSRRDREEKAILRALEERSAYKVKNILAPHRSLWGRAKSALGLTLSPCTTATLELAAQKGDLECAKLVDHGHGPLWRGAALCTAADHGNLSLVQWFSRPITGDLYEIQLQDAIWLAIKNGHIECLQSLRHKWHVVQKTDIILSEVAANGHESMLRFLFDEFLPNDAKQEETIVSGALAHLAYKGKWSGIVLIVECFPDLDRTLFDKILARFDAPELHQVRARLDRVSLQVDTQRVINPTSAVRRI